MIEIERWGFKMASSSFIKELVVDGVKGTFVLMEKPFNKGHPGYLGFTKKCGACGETHNIVRCPYLYYYNRRQIS